MRLLDISREKLKKKLESLGICFSVGGFTVRLKSDIPSILNGITALYSHSEIVESDFVDFNVEIKSPSYLRKFLRPRAQFFFNGITPFFPMDYDQAIPLLEWGLNWCITNHFHEKLVIHAAVVEKNDVALILPGTPGSGKSTLCAALVNTPGWRLLSDELAIYDHRQNVLIPNPRPVSLKNQSIDIIKSFAPNSVFSPTIHHTIKGSVAHMKPSDMSVELKRKVVRPSKIIFPKYRKNINEGLIKVSKGSAFIELAEHSFNYQILQEAGFLSVSNILSHADCYKFVYDGNLHNAIKEMERLVNE